MLPYDGPDRRKVKSDHDALIEVVQVLKNHIENFDVHRKEFAAHVADDKMQFDSINQAIWKATGMASVVVSVVVLIVQKLF